jgi:parallel beta-helix repeat protein
MYGIQLRDTTRWTEIKDNDVLNSEIGIRLVTSDNNDIIDNTVLNNEIGISLEQSPQNNIGKNIISSTGADIHFISSDSITMTDNTMSGGGILMEGDTVSNWNTHNIDTSNTINSKPVIYWKNRSGDTVPAGAGQVILASCDGVTVTNQEISDTAAAIALGFSQDCTLETNTITGNNVSGILLDESNNNKIIKNEISSNIEKGIYIDSSYGNQIMNNSISNNNNGTFLKNSDSNVFYNNSIKNNVFGITLSASPINVFFHNQFISNIIQVQIDDSTGIWNKDYPTCGNYWNDYSGNDLLNGPFQDQIGSDGIGDSPHNLGTNNQDLYPLLNPIDNHVPSAVHNLEAAAGDSNIFLSWESANTLGNFPVTNYNIYRSITSSNLELYAIIGNLQTFSDFSVTNGITYNYCVSAVNIVGEGPKSSEVSAVPMTVPDGPVDLTAVVDLLNVNLSWNIPLTDGGTPVTGYKVYRNEIPGVPEFKADVGTALKYKDKNLNPGTTYYYSVSAFNAIGESKISEEVMVTTPDIPLYPLNPAVEQEEDYVNLSWEPPSHDGGTPVTSYKIYKGPTNDAVEFYKKVGNVTFFIDTEIDRAVMVYYRVSAVNAIGESQLSDDISIMIPDVPGPPAGFTLTSGDSFVHLSWLEPADNGGAEITKYLIYRSTDNQEPFQLLKTRTADFYNDTKVINYYTYYYKVTAVNKAGEGAPTEVLNATPDIIKNKPPFVDVVNADEVSGPAPLTVKFDCSAFDDDGTVVSYLWDFDDGETSAAKNPTHTFAAEGFYEVRITVFDDEGASGFNGIDIIVEEDGDGTDGDGTDGSDSEDTKTSTYIAATGIAIAAGVLVIIFIFLIWPMILRKRGKAETPIPDEKSSRQEKVKKSKPEVVPKKLKMDEGMKKSKPPPPPPDD